VAVRSRAVFRAVNSVTSADFGSNGSTGIAGVGGFTDVFIVVFAFVSAEPAGIVTGVAVFVVRGVL
jgi:hypothetical protein